MYTNTWASLVAQWWRPASQCRRHERPRFGPWVRQIPWRRACQLTSVFLPGESHGQRILAGYSPWGHKESDMTEATFAHAHTYIYKYSVYICITEKDRVNLLCPYYVPGVSVCSACILLHWVFTTTSLPDKHGYPCTAWKQTQKGYVIFPRSHSCQWQRLD